MAAGLVHGVVHLASRLKIEYENLLTVNTEIYERSRLTNRGGRRCSPCPGAPGSA